jgi:hypothetical protein
VAVITPEALALGHDQHRELVLVKVVGVPADPATVISLAAVDDLAVLVI